MAGSSKYVVPAGKKSRSKRPATPGQKRQIWWLAERVGYAVLWRDNEFVRWGMIEKFTNGRCRGISELDQWGVQQVIESLVEYGKNRRILASDRQQKKIYKLAALIGLATPPRPGKKWDTRRLRKWLYRMFEIKKPLFMLRDEADKAIEALKEMDERGYRVGPKAATG